MRRVYEYFEREGRNGVHYKTMVAKHLDEVGFGISVDEKNNYIYATMHYAYEAFTKAPRANGLITDY